MNPPRFEDDPAKSEDIDPAHLIALATRVGNLAGQVERIADGEECRDKELRDLRQDIAEFDNDLKEFSGRVPTKEQWEAITKILANEAGREWLKGRLRFWGWGLLAFLVGIFAIGDKLSQFATWLAALLKKS